MKELEGLVCRLEACLQEELGARERMLALVQAQERAVRARERDELARLAAELEAELRSGSARGAQRDRLLDALARLLGAPRGASTLGSLVERLLPALPRAAERLARLRAELRERTATLARATRRVATGLALQRRLVGELLEAILGGAEGARPLQRTGTLIDAEA